ncbi:hypothetical protein WG66_004657 [Moniliophthora roreri]|nr:hypothetical protein WG66_004657 [Moniliophthora roreri]
MSRQFSIYLLLILLLGHILGCSGSSRGDELILDQAQQALTIRTAYHELGQRVRTTLLAQIGDVAQIQAQQRSASHFLQVVEQHRDVLSSEDFQVVTGSVAEMLGALEQAERRSSDCEPGQQWGRVETSYLVYTGRPGRPRRELDPNILAHGLDLRGPRGLQPIFNCCARTIRRRAVDYGISEPAPPVYIEYDDEVTQQRVRLYHPQPNSVEEQPGSLSDEDLDKVIRHILRIFPSFGRRMITGHMRHLEHAIPRERIRSSYERVQGAPAQLIPHELSRRVGGYCVAGPNSLWHHDGQHGLICYRIVIHAFVDGFSRLVTGIRASNNNEVETVVRLFHAARSVHGTPCRVRGDHGGENLQVAEFMDNTFGAERGSYIWGRLLFIIFIIGNWLAEYYTRSVHNIRIERLW